MKYRIYIVDDHPLMRRGYRSLLESEPDLLVCGEAGSAGEALVELPEANPHLLIADITLKDQNGLELIRRVHAERPGLPVLLSAVASAALLLIFRDDLASTGYSSGILWTVSPLVTIGILAALVAEQARRRTFHAIKAVAVQQRLERELTSMAEAERQRIGRDLHDGLGSRLQGLALMAEGIARRVQNSQVIEADELRELAELLGEGVDEVRRLSRGLDPAPVETGLCRALQALAERTDSAGIDCTFLVEGDERPVSRDATVHLYHIAQEAVTNAIRHGSAGRVDIRLTIRTGTIALDIRDDGSGIPDDPADGQGLRAMRWRAALLDAALRVRRGPTGGTLVSCVVPRAPQPTAPGAA